MKTTKLLLLAYVLGGNILIINTSCSKDPETRGIFNPSPPPSLPPSPSTPLFGYIWVPTNVNVAYPVDSFTLKAYLHRNVGDVSYTWRKIAGPASYYIANPNSLETVVNKLEVGEYEFEISATDVNGVKGSDTLFLQVIKPGQNETTFKNMQWMCFGGCSVSIMNIESYIPQNTPIHVWIWSLNSSDWIRVKHKDQSTSTDTYIYWLNNGALEVYTNHATGKTDLMIQY